MDLKKVINLGHKAKQPLICSSSELVDGLEPHGHIPLYSCGPVTVRTGDRGRGVPGVVQLVGGWRVVYRVLTHQPARGQIEAYLRNYIEYEVHTAV